MLNQKYNTIGTLLAATLLMTNPVNAQWKASPTVYAGSPFDRQTDTHSSGLPAPYAQMQRLLGHKLYGYLLQNAEFIVLQDLVITHLEKQYTRYSNTFAN